MSIDILDIKDQPLGSLFANFLICQNCHIVDRDMDRIKVGHPCKKCGEKSPSGRMYFDHSVRSMIDLMQEFFHKDEFIQSNNKSIRSDKIQNSKIAVVVFFVTLREVLLTKLLKNLMIAQKLPTRIRERLLNDNFTHKNRLDKLFPSLTDDKWKDAVKKVNQRVELNYLEVDKFIMEAVNARNKFLHEGQKYAINKEMAEECIKQIWPLLNLHVSLHNEFVFPIYQSLNKL